MATRRGCKRAFQSPGFAEIFPMSRVMSCCAGKSQGIEIVDGTGFAMGVTEGRLLVVLFAIVTRQIEAIWFAVGS